MKRGWRSIVLGAGIAPALAACAAAVDCSEMGCASQVSVFNLTDLLKEFGAGPVTATLCVDGACQTDVVVLSGSARVRSVVKVLSEQGVKPSSINVRVTFRVTRRDDTLVDTATTTTLTSVAPNGKKCGPICYQTTFTVADGKLVDTGPS